LSVRRHGVAATPAASTPAASTLSERPVRKSEEQGRLFWVWVLTLPIIGLLGASFAFGAPWPSPWVLRIGMVVLAFPVVFGVGEPLFHDAAEARRRGAWGIATTVLLLTVGSYAAGILALFLPIPTFAGVSAILVAAYLTARYLRREW